MEHNNSKEANAICADDKIQIILRQTDYTEMKAREKLK